MANVKNANNMIEIIDENGKVQIRITKNQENQSLVNEILSNQGNTVTDFNQDAGMPQSMNDWSDSLIG